ncbi:sigma-70 family RNA polymerase sigma factor [Corynebacterium auris]|uniref:sigma-70 family RNA polymerase sigma factor n=1 Tax=Corynebacterium auris TaxID=44750 RepID=UPI0025B474CE|nr:sigma-70 family RNA polymerase sigma factor [Corynebacterium auris]WJY67011.1 ECF RNA polymerase sigma factor SigJ [Corynebacterium auris]
MNSAQWRERQAWLISLAYSITGSFHDAEDAASEAWLRLANAENIDDPEAWLTTVTARTAYDLVRAPARARTDYVGPWLPEVATTESGPEDRAVTTENLDRAFSRLIQDLSPVDRVLVVLTQAAGFSAAEAGKLTALTPSAVRKRISRARSILREPEGAPRVADKETLRALAEKLNRGELEALTDILSEGAVLWTDAGGTARAALNPIRGRDKVTRFLAGIIGRWGMPRFRVDDAIGGPVLVAESIDMTRAVTLEIVGGGITGIQVQQNPGKLRLRGRALGGRR